MKQLIHYLFPLLLLSAAAHAGDAANPASTGGLSQVLFGLLIMVGLMAGALWLLKRFGAIRPVAASKVKIVGGISVGNRERILVVEVADQWIVVGVAPGRINALATMARQEGAASAEAAPDTQNFASWLKKTIEKRNGK